MEEILQQLISSVYPWFTGFCTSQVVFPGFLNHQQYLCIIPSTASLTLVKPYQGVQLPTPSSIQNPQKSRQSPSLDLRLDSFSLGNPKVPNILPTKWRYFMVMICDSSVKKIITKRNPNTHNSGKKKPPNNPGVLYREAIHLVVQRWSSLPLNGETMSLRSIWQDLEKHPPQSGLRWQNDNWKSEVTV